MISTTATTNYAALPRAFLTVMALICFGCSPRPAPVARASEAASADDTTGSLFFDDFSYSSLAGFEAHGWIARARPGWPGIPGAVWRSDNVTFLDESNRPGNGILRMTATIGRHVTQTQICHGRKYLEGTYAARVRFTDSSTEGATGDEVVQSFYTITPYGKPMDPAYSEIDFEYLPGGGWGKPAHTLMMTTWDRTQLDPPKDLNESSFRTAPLEGWHTLVFQATDGQVRYFLDGELLAVHRKPNYPDAPMSLNFNLWFINNIGNQSDTRTYVEDIDWVLHAKDARIPPTQVARWVEEFRANSVLFRDTVPPVDPPLDSPCDL